MSPKKPPPSSPKGTTACWREVLGALPRGYSKPEVAADAAHRMLAKPDLVPEPLSEILEHAIALAGS